MSAEVNDPVQGSGAAAEKSKPQEKRINGNTNTSKIKKCAGKESLQRMNYLYQACNALATENESDNSAALMYSNLMVAVSKKAVQRLDIDIKRTICKGCRSILLAGITCKVRIKKKQAIWRCTTCHTAKIFPLEKRCYKPWSQQDDSIVEVLDYKNNSL